MVCDGGSFNSGLSFPDEHSEESTATGYRAAFRANVSIGLAFGLSYIENTRTFERTQRFARSPFYFLYAADEALS